MKVDERVGGVDMDAEVHENQDQDNTSHGLQHGHYNTATSEGREADSADQPEHLPYPARQALEQMGGIDPVPDVTVTAMGGGVVATASADEATAPEGDYEEWKKAQLEAEIDRRNAGLPPEEQIAKSGTKDELAARLRDDDEANA